MPELVLGWLPKFVVGNCVIYVGMYMHIYILRAREQIIFYWLYLLHVAMVISGWFLHMWLVWVEWYKCTIGFLENHE